MEVVIIDDAKLNREAIKIIINKNFRDYQIIGEANSVKSALDLLSNTKPQIILTDIELGDGTAFDIFNKLGYKDYSIIFITAYNHFAVEAFQNNAIDYLLKPISVDKLENALIKASKYYNSDNILKVVEKINSRVYDNQSSMIAISALNEIEYIKTSELVRLEADGKYTTCITSNENRQIISTKNLGEFEKKLPNNDFIRVHHSHIINIKYIKKLSKKDSTITLSNNDVIPISQRKKENFFNHINVL